MSDLVKREEAADRIEAQAKEIAELRAALAEVMVRLVGKPSKISRGKYRLGKYEIVHMVGNLWEIFDGAWEDGNHIATDFTLEEACATVRDEIARATLSKVTS